MLKVGQTGNIGSGKSVVSKVFQTLGVPVFNADEEARKLYIRDDVRAKVRHLFGDKVFDSFGILDRKALAAIVFNDPDSLRILNQVIHPLVREEYLAWNESKSGVRYSIYEAAILFEGGYERFLDYTILVVAPEELRIKRVMARDHVSKDEVISRMANQWDEKLKKEKAGFIIYNDEQEFVVPQVLAIHRQLAG